MGAARSATAIRLEIVAALGLRQFIVDAALRDTAHLTLGDILGLDSIWEQPWENSDRTPEELCEAALSELAGSGQPGPACRELLVKAAGHLAARGWLKGESRKAYGGFRDQRQPESVLDLMHRSPQGIKVLAEVLTAGRRGETARALGEDGEVIELVAGDLQPADNQWIRKTFIDDADRVDDYAVGPPVDGTTPRERVASLDAQPRCFSAEHGADDRGSRADRRRRRPPLPPAPRLGEQRDGAARSPAHDGRARSSTALASSPRSTPTFRRRWRWYPRTRSRRHDPRGRQPDRDRSGPLPRWRAAARIARSAEGPRARSRSRARSTSHTRATASFTTSGRSAGSAARSAAGSAEHLRTSARKRSAWRTLWVIPLHNDIGGDSLLAFERALIRTYRPPANIHHGEQSA